MGNLVKVGDSAFALDEIAAVEGDRVIFWNGKEIRISAKSKTSLLAILPEWQEAMKGSGK